MLHVTNTSASVLHPVSLSPSPSLSLCMSSWKNSCYNRHAAHDTICSHRAGGRRQAANRSEPQLPAANINIQGWKRDLSVILIHFGNFFLNVFITSDQPWATQLSVSHVTHVCNQPRPGKFPPKPKTHPELIHSFISIHILIPKMISDFIRFRNFMKTS